MKEVWEFQIKGDFEGRGYELSAIRKDNGHGHRSWGWGGDDKIITFSSGVGGNPTRDPDFAIAATKLLVASLNTREFLLAAKGPIPELVRELVRDRVIYGNSFETEDGARVDPTHVVLSNDGTYFITNENGDSFPEQDTCKSCGLPILLEQRPQATRLIDGYVHGPCMNTFAGQARYTDHKDKA